MKTAIKITGRMTAAILLLTPAVPCGRAQEADDVAQRRGECRRVSDPDRRRCTDDAGLPGSTAPVLDALGRHAGFDEARLALGLIGEDLDFLRSAGHYLSRAASRGGELDLNAVGKATSEVSKRARRLKDSLALPDPQAGATGREFEEIEDAEQLRGALWALSALIAEAVRNPVMGGHLLDPALSERAWRDLAEIVVLGELIKAGSEALARAGR